MSFNVILLFISHVATKYFLCSMLLANCSSVDRGGSDEVTNRGWSDEVLLKP